MQITDWCAHLEEHLDFPFEMKRVEDDASEDPDGGTTDPPFSLGHTFKVVAIDDDDDIYGVVIKAREGRWTGYIPMVDCEVCDASHKNAPFIDAYLEWFGNDR